MKDSVSRRNVIINLLTLPVMASAAVAATTMDASAAATTDPKTAQYQTKPKNGQQCSTCSLYVPAKMNPAKANGTCKLVKGAIAPQGWCKFYSKKS